MHIITRKRLLEFAEKYPNSSDPLDSWYRIVKHTDFDTFSELRNVFPSADLVERITIFNIGGNKYRLITYIVYKKKRIYIRNILTHEQYEKGKWKE